MSKKRSSPNRASKAAQVKELRAKQLDQLNEAIASLESRLQSRREQRTQLNLLDSVSLGLYEEVDKLSKKAPAEPITDLVLEQVNDVVRETKQLAGEDTYVQRLNEFVPAGDNPQHRDAVVILRQIRQGLDRFKQNLDSSSRLLNSRLDEARSVRAALQLYLRGQTTVEVENIDQFNVHLPSFWITGKYPKVFNFDRLDDTDIRSRFGETA